MLSNELMGVLALWILWVNTLLVIADAFRRLGLTRKEIAAWVRGGLVEGTIAEGDGPNGTLAKLEVHQLGRAADAKAPTIHYGQAQLTSRVYGGAVEVGGQRRRVEPSEQAIVWPEPAALASAVAPNDSAEDFDAAYHAAGRRRGHARTAAAELRIGDRVWLVDGRFVSAIDPKQWLSRQGTKVVGFSAVCLLLAIGCTVLAVWPPVFGLVSTLGGVAGLAFFLLVQPAGTALRDATEPPHRAVLRATWSRAETSEPAASSLTA